MCGITGVINTAGKSVNRYSLELMVNAIEHRGPDGQGMWLEKNIGLGHTRLAILDLTEAGAQPMHSESGRFILSYNGEIYNFKEIKKDLQTLGYSFKSNTDTEVVLNSLIEWGSEAIIKFNGMFALAFWDRAKNELLLARDRYGIKPLYYAIQDNKVYFSSEQKAICAHPEFKKKLNEKGLLEYFTFQNFFSEQTLFVDIKTFPSGNVAKLNSGAADLKFERYWDYNFQEPIHAPNYNNYIEELQYLFTNAVERQLVSDVEIGCYLSGGMDSGSITAVVSNKIPNLKTFTCGFDTTNATDIEMLFDERHKAEDMSAFFQTEQYEIMLKAGDLERCLTNLTYHLEEPRVGQSYPNYYSAKLASKFVNVVMSGAGGDELFGGYPWRYYRTVGSKSFDDYIDNYYAYWQRLVSNTELTQLFRPISKSVKDVWTRDIFKSVFKYQPDIKGTPEDYINHSLYFEAKTFLHGLLIVEDKLSMAHGLETRLPFLDNELVDFAMKCPVSFKLKNLSDAVRLNENDLGKKTRSYFQKTNDGKIILRDAMKHLLPDEVTKRVKQGFSAPDETWFRRDSKQFLIDKLLDSKNPLFDFLDYETVKALTMQHFTGSRNRRLLMWSFLNVSYWLKQNI